MLTTMKVEQQRAIEAAGPAAAMEDLPWRLGDGDYSAKVFHNRLEIARAISPVPWKTLRRTYAFTTAPTAPATSVSGSDRRGNRDQRRLQYTDGTRSGSHTKTTIPGPTELRAKAARTILEW